MIINLLLYISFAMSVVDPTTEEIAKLYERKAEECMKEIEYDKIRQKEIEEDNARLDVLTDADVTSSFTHLFFESIWKTETTRKNSIHINCKDIMHLAKVIGQKRLGCNPFIPRHINLREIIKHTYITHWYMEESIFDSNYITYHRRKQDDCCLLI